MDPSPATVSRISDRNLSAVLSQLEAANALTPPPELEGEAREMFLTLADGNKSRPWNAGHALALADYCRVSILWSREFRAIEAEGTLTGEKQQPNPRFRILSLLAAQRLALAKLLGIAVQANDRYLAGTAIEERKLRAVGASMAKARGSEGGYLLE